MYTIAFVLEQALGHVTHARNLQQNVPPLQRLDPRWLLLPFETTGLAARIPLYRSNWSLRSGLRARRQLSAARRAGKLDGIFFHTQVPAVLCSDWARAYPSLVSLDATPLQYDQLGDFYHHQPGPAWLEQLKRTGNQALYSAARRLVTWTTWTRDSLVRDYGVPPEKITVIPPGVNPSLWSKPPTSLSELPLPARQTPGVSELPLPARERAGGEGESPARQTPPGSALPPTRVLFVGGDLLRKGGDLLLAAFRSLAVSRPDLNLELHLVTKTAVEPGGNIFVYRDMGPNDPRLVALYQCCDIFALPTSGDCLPMVLSEAGAAGLPCISTTVAGIPEIVEHGESGLLIPPRDATALRAALETLASDPALRQRMGRRAVQIVNERFDAQKNTVRLVDLILETLAEAK